MIKYTEDFLIELSSGAPCTVEVTVEINLDDEYGADADGNRGTPVYFIDEVFFDIPYLDDDGLPLMPEDREELEERLLNAAEKYNWMGDACIY